MMSLREDKMTAPVFFKEYSDGNCILNVGEYSQPIIVSYKEVLFYDEELSSLNDIKKSHLELILSTNPEVIIIGTGSKQTLPPIDVINEIAKAGKSVDFMTSSMACKTYNLLVNENRNVSCIIF